MFIVYSMKLFELKEKTQLFVYIIKSIPLLVFLLSLGLLTFLYVPPGLTFWHRSFTFKF
jgi:hypothetical protein